VPKVSKRPWPSLEEAMRTVDPGVFDDSEFDLLLRDKDERGSPAPPRRRLRPRRATAHPATDDRDGQEAE
jgi:hypothetical protein